ncbi:MAG: hypothetical protein ABH864_01740 [archaeon]
MRKIGSEKETEAKRKRNTLILSVFMLIILIGGTAGYAFITSSRSNNDPTTTNTGIRQLGNRWIVTIDGIDLSFANPPESVQDVPVDISVSKSTYRGASIYIVSDNNAVNIEIATTLGTYTSRVQRACYGPCEDDLPEKDCSENLIIWRDNPENRVYQDENCVFIEGDIRAVDAFLYNALGVQSQ